jgi:hypothetical protein
MVANESLLCHLKPKHHMLTKGLYLLSSLGHWMKNAMTNVLKIIVHS